MPSRKPPVLSYASPDFSWSTRLKFLQKFFWPIVACLFIAVVLLEAGVGWASAVLQLLTSGLLLLAWLTAGYGWGMILRSAFRIKDRDALVRVTTLAAGLGAISLLVLGLGLLGAMNQPVAILILLIGFAVVCRDVVRRRQAIHFRVLFVHWWWLLLVPLASFVITAAMLPAGLLWGADEPNAYDVVEYHLQVPREWFEIGRIVPLTHNVFSFFPFNVEMHYLLAMHVMGGPWVAQFLAQMMHAAFIGLTIAAVYVAVRDRGKFPAIMSAALAASTPWMPMLGAIAYNEGGLLLFGTLAMAWAMRGIAQWNGESRSVDSLTPSPGTPGEGGVRVLSQQGDTSRSQQNPHPTLSRNTERGTDESESTLTDSNANRSAKADTNLKIKTRGLADVAATPASPLPAAATQGSRLQMFVIAGVMAGFACGCKLTGVPMILVGVPMAVAAVWIFSIFRGGKGKSAHRPVRDSSSAGVHPSPLPSPQGEREVGFRPTALVSALALFVVAGLLIFSPWMIRNYAWVKNPVFPEMQNTLGRGYYNAEQSARFDKAHRARPDQQSVGAKLAEFRTQVSSDWRFGYVLGAGAWKCSVLLLIAIIALLVTIRRADSQFMLLMLLGLTAFWLFATHLQGRFYVLAIPIAAISIGRAVVRADGTMHRLMIRGLPVFVVILLVIGCVATQQRYDEMDRNFRDRAEVSLGSLIGMTRFDQSENFMSDPTWMVVLVGDAQAFFYHRSMSHLQYRTVFDADTTNADDAVAAWTAGIPAGQRVFLWIDEGEITRLHRTYGTPLLPSYLWPRDGNFIPFTIPAPATSPASPR